MPRPALAHTPPSRGPSQEIQTPTLWQVHQTLLEWTTKSDFSHIILVLLLMSCCCFAPQVYSQAPRTPSACILWMATQRALLSPSQYKQVLFESEFVLRVIVDTLYVSVWIEVYWWVFISLKFCYIALSNDSEYKQCTGKEKIGSTTLYKYINMYICYI